MRSGGVHALAHITGGGLTENLPRVLPDGCGTEIDLTSWALPPVFDWLSEVGGIAPSEMLKTFNAGIGMVLVVDPAKADDLADLLAEQGETVYRIGRVTSAPEISYTGQLA